MHTGAGGGATAAASVGGLSPLHVREVGRSDGSAAFGRHSSTSGSHATSTSGLMPEPVARPFAGSAQGEQASSSGLPVPSWVVSPSQVITLTVFSQETPGYRPMTL